MATIQLDDGKTELLKQLLEVRLSELHMEIAHTDSREYREMLKQSEVALNSMVDELNVDQAQL